jgi:GT2 family glycosyltransferase
LALVSIGIVTWNAANHIQSCVNAVRAQTHAPVELLVADNASTDGTREVLERVTAAAEREYFASNRGFSTAHNALIRRSRGDFYLALNPDVVLEPEFVARVVAAVAGRERVGAASGKLLRDDGRTLDSTGIVMHASQRHLDRGADEPDQGQFDRTELVFGASGAAACYRRRMLEDVRIDGEYFDEDFFAYREDADLAWRAQLLGWDCLYVPEARARHVRRVTPERRGTLPPEINRYSVRNRFLLRLKNQTGAHAARFLLPATVRDLQVVGYVLLRERTSLGGLADVVRLLPRTWRKRRAIMRKRVRPAREIARWFQP